MAYFDYSLPQTISFEGLTKPIGDALTEVMKRRDQRKQQEEQLKFQREQEQRRYDQQAKQFEYQNRIEDRKELQGERDFSQRQQLFRNTQAAAVRKAIADGNIEEANRLAAETQLFDPHTGAVKATGSLTQAPARDIGPAPEKPDLQEMPPEMRAIMGAVPGMGVVPRAVDAQQLGQSRRFDAASQAYSEEAKRAEDERPYRLKFGEDDPGVDLSTQGQRYAGRQREAEDFLAGFRGVPQNANDRAAMQQVYAQILGGLDPQKGRLAYDKIRAGVMQEEGRNTRSAGRDKAMVDAAKARGAAFDWKQRVGEGNLAVSAERAGNTFFQDFLKNTGFKGDLSVTKDLVDSYKQLGVRNSLLDVGAGATLAKKANGAGVLTDKDYDRFWLAIGDGEDRTEDWFERAVSGQMGEGKRRVVMAGIIEKVKEQEARLNQIAGQADKKFANEPWWPGTRAAYFEFTQNTPEMGEARGPRIGTSGVPTKKRRGPPEVDAKKKAKAKAAGAADPLDEYMQ